METSPPVCTTCIYQFMPGLITRTRTDKTGSRALKSSHLIRPVGPFMRQFRGELWACARGLITVPACEHEAYARVHSRARTLECIIIRLHRWMHRAASLNSRVCVCVCRGEKYLRNIYSVGRGGLMIYSIVMCKIYFSNGEIRTCIVGFFHGESYFTSG